MVEDLLKKIAVQAGVTVAVSVLVGIGSAAITGQVLMARMEDRITILERDMGRYSADLEKNWARVDAFERETIKTQEGHDKELARLDAVFSSMSSDMKEVKADVKLLLRSRP